MAWKKGQSGNPSGRKKGTQDYRERIRRALTVPSERHGGRTLLDVVLDKAWELLEHPDPWVRVDMVKLFLKDGIAATAKNEEFDDSGRKIFYITHVPQKPPDPSEVQTTEVITPERIVDADSDRR